MDSYVRNTLGKNPPRHAYGKRKIHWSPIWQSIDRHYLGYQEEPKPFLWRASRVVLTSGLGIYRTRKWKPKHNLNRKKTLMVNSPLMNCPGDQKIAWNLKWKLKHVCDNLSTFSLLLFVFIPSKLKTEILVLTCVHMLDSMNSFVPGILSVDAVIELEPWWVRDSSVRLILITRSKYVFGTERLELKIPFVWSQGADKETFFEYLLAARKVMRESLDEIKQPRIHFSRGFFFFSYLNIFFLVFWVLKYLNDKRETKITLAIWRHFDWADPLISGTGFVSWS